LTPGEALQLGPGERIRCLRSGADGGWFEFEMELDPGVAGPPRHHHPDEELVEVLEGELVLTLDGADRTLAAGGTLLIPPGAPHTFRVPKRGTGARVFVRHGWRFEKLVDQHAGGPGGFSRMARYLTEVDPRSSYMCSPFVRTVLRVVAWWGRLRGVGLRP